MSLGVRSSLHVFDPRPNIHIFLKKPVRCGSIDDNFRRKIWVDTLLNEYIFNLSVCVFYNLVTLFTPQTSFLVCFFLGGGVGGLLVFFGFFKVYIINKARVFWANNGKHSYSLNMVVHILIIIVSQTKFIKTCTLQVYITRTFFLLKSIRNFCLILTVNLIFFKDDLVFLKFVRLAHIRSVFGLQETPFIYHQSYQLCKFLKEAQIKCGGIFFYICTP